MRITDKRRIEQLLNDKIDAARNSLPPVLVSDLAKPVRTRVESLLSRLEALARQDHIRVDWEVPYRREDGDPGYRAYVMPSHPKIAERKRTTKQRVVKLEALKEQLVIELYADEVDGQALVRRFIQLIEEV